MVPLDTELKTILDTTGLASRWYVRDISPQDNGTTIVFFGGPLNLHMTVQTGWTAEQLRQQVVAHLSV